MKKQESWQIEVLPSAVCCRESKGCFIADASFPVMWLKIILTPEWGNNQNIRYSPLKKKKKKRPSLLILLR